MRPLCLITWFTLLLYLLAVTGCSDGDASQAGELPQTTVTQPEDRSGQTNATGGLSWAQKRYERSLQMERSGLLLCDTVAYRCGTTSGTFTFCRSDGELVRAGHEQQKGEHDYLSEWYYYDGTEMYLAELKAGSWRFGGPESDQQVRLSSTEPTIDEVHEEWRYFERGNLLDRRFKDYTLRSWTDTLQPQDLPGKPQGTGVAGEIGSEVVLEVAESGTYECR